MRIEMTPSEQTDSGWTDFGGQARKFHYVPADDDRALCGKWGLSPFVQDVRSKTRFQPDTGPSPDDCAACRRKLGKRS